MVTCLAGVYKASFDEVLARFGRGTSQRHLVTARLKRIYILVVRDDFRTRDYAPEVFPMFDHGRAQRELGASIFVVRPAFLLGETVDEFIAHWQITRAMNRRGIVEIVAEDVA